MEPVVGLVPNWNQIQLTMELKNCCRVRHWNYNTSTDGMDAASRTRSLARPLARVAGRTTGRMTDAGRTDDVDGGGGGARNIFTVFFHRHSVRPTVRWSLPCLPPSLPQSSFSLFPCGGGGGGGNNSECDFSTQRKGKVPKVKPSRPTLGQSPLLCVPSLNVCGPMSMV